MLSGSGADFDAGAGSGVGAGNVHHLGGSVLGRMNYRSSKYSEGSFRVGSVCNSFGTSGLGGTGFSSSSPYVGVQGYVGRWEGVSGSLLVRCEF